jgi:hypothetical protein
MKNNPSIHNSKINHVSHMVVSINAIRHGITVAVYRSRIAKTTFHTLLTGPFGCKRQNGNLWS